MTPIRKLLSWFALSGALASALMARFVSSALLESFLGSADRATLTRVPALTAHLMESPWPITTLPLVVAVIAVAASIAAVRFTPNQRDGFHTISLIAAGTIYFSCMVVVAAVLAFGVLPRALGNI